MKLNDAFDPNHIRNWFLKQSDIDTSITKSIDLFQL